MPSGGDINMKTRIKCDKCDWFIEDGLVPAWFFRRCPKCGAVVIDKKDLALWCVVKFISGLDWVTRLFIHNPQTVTIHIDSAKLKR